MARSPCSPPACTTVLRHFVLSTFPSLFLFQAVLPFIYRVCVFTWSLVNPSFQPFSAFLFHVSSFFLSPSLSFVVRVFLWLSYVSQGFPSFFEAWARVKRYLILTYNKRVERYPQNDIPYLPCPFKTNIFLFFQHLSFTCIQTFPLLIFCYFF